MNVAKELLGLGLVAGSAFFYLQSVRFFGEGDHVAGILQIFVGLATTRSGLELVKLGLIAESSTKRSDPRRTDGEKSS
jgi:hypothetical protein